ncbi:hypothetical protein [Edaphobacter aggregans]|uniref:hypothetical protein n=1 Tax=Edaphobacter aggregans TaxID=570835 RepID=UPI000550D420|nr:hypothetical protein [Edaphobacter aggregans]
MSRSTYPLKLPTSIKNAAQRLAKEDGVSLNQWISVAVAQKIGVVETADAFFERRSQGATGKTLKRLLRQAPDRRPDSGDAID